MTSKSLDPPANGVVQGLTQCGVTHVVYLPSTESASLYGAIKDEPSLTMVPVCREGEGMAVAMGLWLGGKKPAVLIQNTGFLESGDSVRGLLQGGKVPLIIVVGYRGYGRGNRDLAAVYIEPVLKAYDVPYMIALEQEDPASQIVKADQMAQEESRAVAVLFVPEDE